MRHALLALLLFAPLPAQQTASHLRVLELTGTPYERGLTHGKALRTEIADFVKLWGADMAKASGVEADVFVERFLAGTEFEAAIRRYTPGLLDEVRGIADGSGQSYGTMLVYQLLDEVWAQTPLLFPHKCSSVGVDRDGDQPTFVAQNLDLPPWMHAHPTVLHIVHPDRALESFVVTIPGVIGANGLNSKRIGVCVNTILQIRACRDGLPVAFIVRGLLEQEDHAAAIEFLKRVKHASGQHYTIGGPDTAPGFECSAGKVVQFVPFAGVHRTFHTNHPVVNDDYSEIYLQAIKKAGKQPGEQMYQCQRFAVLEKQLAPDTPATIENVIKALQTRKPGPVCNSSTYVCTFMVLGEHPELRISAGPPDTTPFEVLSFVRPAASGR